MTRFHLKETQVFLWKLLSAPEGVSKALKGLSIESLPIRGDKRLSGAERLDIYANMYFFRIRDSLKEDFPAVVKLVGEDRFHNLITDYLLKHPSRHWSLRYAGERLPRFLRGRAEERRWPFVSELARFEWALLEAFDAPDAEILREEDLKNLSPDLWGGIVLKPVPSVRILRCRFAIDRIREQILKGRPVSRVQRERTDLLVWRKDLKVFYRRLGGFEKQLLKKGESLGRFLERRIGRAGREEVTQKVAGLFRAWLGEGLLATGFKDSTNGYLGP